MQIRGFVACVLLILVAGCGGEAPPTAGQERALPPPPPPVAAATDDPVDDTAVVAASDADTANVGSRKKAEVGLGRKSQNIKGSGYLPTLARTPHRVKESLNLSQATQALNFYKAMNEGRGPKTHEEYMKKVIKENDLKLPKLPEGQRYRYDPDTEELMVEELVDEP